MANNYTITQGSGTTFKSTDTGSVHTAHHNVDVAVIPGVAATNLGKAEDAAHVTGDTGVMMLGVRQDTQASFGADGDYVPPSIASDGGVRVSIVGAAAATLIDTVADDAVFTVGTTETLMAGFFADETATDSVDEGDGGAARMTLDRKQIVTAQPHTAGGLSVFKSSDIDETEEDVKTSAGQVYGFYAVNRTTSPLYIRFYDATAASVTVGSTAHLLGPIEIPANASDHVALHFQLGGMGIPFATAISVAATTGFADADTGAPAANACIINVFYK